MSPRVLTSSSLSLRISHAGYIGGSVLSRLLEHPEHDQFAITALVRSPEKAEKLKSFGVNAVEGSIDEWEKLEGLASQAHIVLSIVSTGVK